MEEIWKPVVGYEGLYEVSNVGRVKGLDRQVRTKGGGLKFWKGKLLKPALNTGGYPFVGLCKDGVRTSMQVHTLIMDTFVGPRPKGFEVCHNDNDRSHSVLSNLRYDSRKGNHADMRAHGTWQEGEAHPQSKLTAEDVLEIRAGHARGLTCRELAEQYNITHQAIRAIVNRVNWRCLP